MSLLSTLALAALVTVAQAQSLTVVNQCGESVFLYTQNSFGSIANNVNVAAGASTNMGISSNWDGAINVGELLVFCTNHRNPTHLPQVLDVTVLVLAPPVVPPGMA